MDLLPRTSALLITPYYGVGSTWYIPVPLIRRSIRNPEPFMDNSNLVPIGIILRYSYIPGTLPTYWHAYKLCSEFVRMCFYRYIPVLKCVQTSTLSTCAFKSGSQSSTVSSCTSMYLELFCTSSVYVQHVLIPYENQQISVGLHFDRLDWRSSTVFERRFCCPRQLAFPKIHNGSFEISRDIANAHREI